MPAERLVLQLGPQPGLGGGMGSVLGTYLERPIAGHRMEVVPTWRAGERTKGAAPAAAALARIVGEARRRAVPPTIAHLHLSERGSFVREGALLLAARRLGLRTVATLHGGSLAPFAAAHPRLARRVLEAPDVLVCLGPANRALVDQILGRRRGGLVTIPNPVDVPDVVVPLPERPTALFAGRVERLKGIDVLLEAWPAVLAAVPSARLLLVGPPGDLDPPAVEGVEQLGPLPRDRVLALVEGSWIAVLASRIEVMPMTLLEAMAAGRGVVATAVGECPHFVGEAGRLVPPEDPAALAEALVAMLGDRASATEAGCRGRAKVLAEHTPAVVADQLREVYDSLA